MTWKLEHNNSLGIIERMLLLAIALLSIYAVFIFGQEKNEWSPRLAVVQSEPTVVSSQKMLEPLKMISSYTEQLGRRDIFNFASSGIDVSSEQRQAGAEKSLPSHLKIVGVLIGKPSEVIIEDTKVQQTYFVQEGKTVGLFHVLHASKENVVMEYQGQSIEVDPHK